MRLHVIYRSAPGENQEPRPAYYSKGACLGSFLVSLGAPGLAVGDVIFLNDGPIRGDLRTAMDASGIVLELPGVGNAASYRAAVSLLDWRNWPDDDLVYLVEDDYLHVPEALPSLMEAAGRLPGSSFFTLYRHPDYFSVPDHERYRRATRGSAATVSDYRWEAIWGTTLTYAARVGRLRYVAGVHLLGARAKGRPNDAGIWKTTQRAGPYHLLYLFARQGGMKDSDAVRSAASEFLHRWSRRRHLLMFPTPTLATHLQNPYVSEGRVWGSVAAEGEAALTALVSSHRDDSPVTGIPFDVGEARAEDQPG